jgi:hypothetical protein
MHKPKTNRYKCFVVHSQLMIQSLLGNEKKPDIYDLGVTDGIKEMLAVRGFTKVKIRNTNVGNREQLGRDSAHRLLSSSYHP